MTKKYISVGETDLFYNSMGLCGKLEIGTLTAILGLRRLFLGLHVPYVT